MIGHGWPFGPYPPGGLRRLGPHVVAYHGDAYPVANSAIVRSSEATLVFDANLLRFARVRGSVLPSVGSSGVGSLTSLTVGTVEGIVLHPVKEDHRCRG